jgi:site-specific recombinase XerD
MRNTGLPGSAATINTQVAAVKALLGFAHQVGYTRFNVGPLIKIRKAPRKLAQRIMPEVDIHLLIRATTKSRHPERDRALFETAYYGGVRVSELASLRWEEIIPRENGEVQLAVIGEGTSRATFSYRPRSLPACWLFAAVRQRRRMYSASRNERSTTLSSGQRRAPG